MQTIISYFNQTFKSLEWKIFETQKIDKPLPELCLAYWANTDHFKYRNSDCVQFISKFQPTCNYQFYVNSNCLFTKFTKRFAKFRFAQTS